MPDHAILGHTVTAAEIGARIAEQHPLSAIFPAMTAADFAQLRADIAANGLRQPIIIYDGQVLDGWHRLRACSETGTEILAEAFTGDDRAAQDFVLSANLARRHLTTSDRAIIAAKLATLGRGEKKVNDSFASSDHWGSGRARSCLGRQCYAGAKGAGTRHPRVDIPRSKQRVEHFRSLPPVAAARSAARCGRGRYTIEAWRALPDDERAALLGLRNRKARLNRRIRRGWQRHRLGTLVVQPDHRVQTRLPILLHYRFCLQRAQCSIRIGFPRRSTWRRR